MKKILEIHEFHEKFKVLPLHEYILTFDDGLYSQYLQKDFLKSLGTEIYFFISSGIINKNNKQKNEIVHCAEAHEKARAGNFENYMSWDNIHELKNMSKLFHIGYHGHEHINLQSIYNLMHKKQLIEDDVNCMINEFAKNKIYPSTFCFPYNNEDFLLKHILQMKGIHELFGKGRIAIEHEYERIIGL